MLKFRWVFFFGGGGKQTLKWHICSNCVLVSIILHYFTCQNEILEEEEKNPALQANSNLAHISISMISDRFSIKTEYSLSFVQAASKAISNVLF